MSFNRRRVGAIVRKELREYRCNRSIVAGMSIFPLVFLIQPLVSVFASSSTATIQLRHHHELIYAGDPVAGASDAGGPCDRRRASAWHRR